MNTTPTAQEQHPQFLDDQRQFFDELISLEWDSYENSQWDAVRRFEVDRLFDRVLPTRVLNIGCGCGFQDRLMAERAGVAEVVGMDYSTKSIERANAAYPHACVKRKVADIFELPAGDFDLAVSFQVIEHLRDAAGFLEACARQVRPGGWVAAATPNRRRISNRVLAMRGRPEAMADPQHFREYTVDELRDIGERAGLRFEASFGYGMSLILPRLNRQAIPQRFAPRWGYWLAPLADCFCIIFRR